MAKPCGHKNDVTVPGCAPCKIYKNPRIKAIWDNDQAAMSSGLALKNPTIDKRFNAIKKPGCGTCGGNNRDALLKKKAQIAKQAVIAKNRVQKRRVDIGHLPPDTTKRIMVDNTRPMGLGDALTGLTALAGLRQKFPLADLWYYVRADKLEWVNLFTGFTATATPVTDVAFVCHPNFSYETELVTKESRTDLYGEFCGVKPALPTPKPIDPAAQQWAEQYRSAVLFSPLVFWASRQLNPSWWKVFIAECRDAGLRPIAMAHQGGDLKPYNCEHIVGELPARVAALMSVAKLTVACDTGPAWLAGCLGCRGIVLGGVTNVEKLFSMFPSLELVQPDTRCSGCMWKGEFVTPSCHQFCWAAHTINPTDIVRKIKHGL